MTPKKNERCIIYNIRTKGSFLATPLPSPPPACPLLSLTPSSSSSTHTASMMILLETLPTKLSRQFHIFFCHRKRGAERPVRIGDGVHFEAEEGTGEEGPGAERPAGPGLPRRLPQGRPLLEEAAGWRGTRGARRHSREEIKGSIGRSAECVCCVRPGRARGERWPRRAGGLRGEEQLQADVGLEEGDPRGRAKYDGRQGVQVGKQKRKGPSVVVRQDPRPREAVARQIASHPGLLASQS